MYFFTAPTFIKQVSKRSLTWQVQTEEKAIWLTFDDGPEPTVTPWVLDTLEKYQAKATFFCLGKNVEANPEVYQRIMQSGHTIGNHTYNHMNGWNSHTKDYIEDVAKCQQVVNSPYFRPPYGKIKPSQILRLKKKYTIVMWSLISGDFDRMLDKDKCLEAVLKYTNKGAIVVFHDSLKAKENLMYVLPKFLEHFTGLGYTFKAL